MTQEQPKEQIVFLIDTNALIEFGNHEKFVELCQNIDARHTEGEIINVLSPIVFYEQLCGAKDRDRFYMARANIRRAQKISCGGHILCDPKYHLKYSLGLISFGEIQKCAKDWIETYRIFCRCPDFDDFTKKFGQMQRLANKELDEIESGHKNIVNMLKNYSQSCQEKEFDIWSVAQDSRIRAGVIDHFGLRTHIIAYNDQDIFDRLPSLSYYIAASTCIYSRELSQSRKPLRSDHFDLEQLVYLDCCDYMVTNDIFLGEVINQSRNKDLAGRIISVADFFQNIHDPYLLKRAPLPLSMTKLGA